MKNDLPFGGKTIIALYFFAVVFLIRGKYILIKASILTTPSILLQ
jgi:hypothetical protein